MRTFILADAGLPLLRRTAIASALNTVAKALRQPLEALPANPVELRPLLAGTSASMARLAAGTWRNVLSLLNAALSRLHGDMLPQRMDLAPSDAWRECLAGVSKNPHVGHALGRLARYATRRGVEPEAVDDAFISLFRNDLIYRSLTAEPERVARDTARAWNDAAVRCSNWPQTRLLIADNRRRCSLPWGKYPTSLQHEVESWLDWLGRDRFADRDFRPLRPISLAARHRQLALYLGALVEAGEDPAGMTSLAAVVTPQLAARALRIFYARSGGKLTTHLAQIAGLVLILARRWAKLDPSQVDHLRRLARQLMPPAVGLTPRNEARLAQLDDSAAMDRVLALPQTLVRQAHEAALTQKSAQQFQTAVVVEIFLMTGLRISNLAGLQIGGSLILRPDGGVAIQIPACEVKNNVPISADLPADSSKMLRRYITRYRPLLGAPNSAWLFPGTKSGTHKCSDGLRDQVTRAMERYCGVAWHPHLFRHLLAKLQLEQDAGADGLITRALGHKRAETTRRHYTGFQTRSAIRQHDDLVLRRRATILGEPRRGSR